MAITVLRTRAQREVDAQLLLMRAEVVHEIAIEATRQHRQVSGRWLQPIAEVSSFAQGKTGILGDVGHQTVR